MQAYTTTEIQAMDRFYRGNFMNTLSGYKSASLLVSQDQNGLSNVAIFSNIVHLGADPGLIGFVNRPLQAAPHSLRNIEQTGLYTLNLIPRSIIEAAHQSSAKYPDGVSEFDHLGIHPLLLTEFACPFVQESPIKYGLKLEEIIPIKQNNTFFVIGSIQVAYVDPAIIDPDGFIRLEKEEIITSLGTEGYYLPTFLEKRPYAKV